MPTIVVSTATGGRTLPQEFGEIFRSSRDSLRLADYTSTEGRPELFDQNLTFGNLRPIRKTLRDIHRSGAHSSVLRAVR